MREVKKYKHIDVKDEETGTELDVDTDGQTDRRTRDILLFIEQSSYRIIG